MNNHDHAVVIGIRRYADSDPERAIGHLRGPDNDAAAVAAWLRRGNGGGLLDENVRVVRSADLPDPFPDEGAVGPQQQAVVERLRSIANLDRTAYNGQYAGRRLYIYVAGHGIANESDNPAVLTAEAVKGAVRNVLIMSWVKWFYEAALFKELVLWADCCANRMPFVSLEACDLAPEAAMMADQTDRFVGFAAGFNKAAVENQMPDGQWHGAFTYALVQGLDGAAGTPVTSARLRDYLTNNMASFMRPEQRVPGVSKEPVFGTTDDISFAGPPATPRFPVTLEFPPAWVGSRAAISTTQSSPPTVETVLEAPEWTPLLEAGSYVVYVPDKQRTALFSVSGEGTDAVTIS